jgi:dihydroorotase
VADITVFDPKKKWTVDKTKFESKSKNTVLDGVELIGRSEFTVVDGKVIEMS